MKNLILASILLLNAAFFALAEKKADHEITISGNDTMQFDIKNFDVTAGNKVKIIFKNPDATQHNLVFVEPGAVEEVGMAGNEMAKDPKGLSKGFIPESDKILHHTKLLDPDTAEVLRFIAPTEPGTYPYLCTFPGHWIIMKGEMIVR